MDVASIDWSTATVKGDRVTVRVAGERPKGWKQSFGLTATLLAADTPFGEVSLKGDKVTVNGVRPGSEDQLRFLLEGAVQQSNADHPAQVEEEEPEPDASEDDDAADDPESVMTERLRGFAEPENR